MRARRIVYGERAVGVALRPHLLTAAQYARLAHASEAVAAAFEKVCDALLADASLLERVRLTEAELRLATIETRLPRPTVTTRLDAFVHGDSVKFVEYNAENPSSIIDQAGINEVLFDVRAMRSLAERRRLRQFDPAAALLASIVKAYRDWSGRAGRPRVAIVDWDGLPTAPEFEALRNYFAARGVPTVICAPDELEYEGGILRRGDFRVDVVYKRVIIHELLSRADASHPLLRAYAKGDVCVVNPFRCKVVHKKAAFEFLTDETYARWFTPGELEVLGECVPWTRRFEARRTTHGGKTVDLVEHVRSSRGRFVLKPNDDYGGAGVVLGKNVSESDWDATIETALAGDYVVQELIDLRTEVFPVFGEERWAFQPMYVDTNPFLFDGRVEGAMVRLSGSPIVNVTSGGGETGFFVVEDD
jgi:hypothetical protein